MTSSTKAVLPGSVSFLMEPVGTSGQPAKHGDRA